LACTSTARVRALLTGPTGQITPQLQRLATFLLNNNSAEQAHHIVNGAGWMLLLTNLVDTGNPITHEMLNTLPQDTRVGHLRAILVLAGVLDVSLEDLEPLGPWLKILLADLPSKTVAVLRPYAHWSVLPRSRQRAARLGSSASAPKSARVRARPRQMTAAVAGRTRRVTDETPVRSEPVTRRGNAWVPPRRSRCPAKGRYNIGHQLTATRLRRTSPVGNEWATLALSSSVRHASLKSRRRR
jgi:hypothetical protein